MCDLQNICYPTVYSMGKTASGQHRLAEVKFEGLRRYRQSLVSGQEQDSERVALSQHSHHHLI